MSMASLPDDLLHMVCASLWQQEDFDTLYHCACAAKQLAYPALANLYRMHDVAPVTDAGNDEIDDQSKNTTFKAAEESQARITMKWASMWRSIILSSLGKTLLPYSQYIRGLNLYDLRELIADDKFGVPRISDALFGGELSKYRVDKTIQGSRKKNKYIHIDADATVNGLADVIVPHAPMLERFKGHQQLDMSILAKSIPRLSKLQDLSVFRGEALENTGPLIRQHCHLLDTLQVFGWQGPEADSQFATWLTEVRPQTLRSFEVLGTSNIGAKSFSAFNSCHSESLKELYLESIKSDAIPALAMMKDCTHLTSLLLAENAPPTQDLEKGHHDDFVEVVAWLRACKDLKSISLTNFVSGPPLLTPVLLESKISLTKLSLEGYALAGNKDFHQALAHQATLEELDLKGEGGDIGGPDNDVLVESLSKLENLTELRLREVSDGFANQHIIQLANSLQKLEVLFTSGYGITDQIWSAVASLKRLRQLDINALTRFTANGIVNFILTLEESNRGLALIIMMQDDESNISEEDQAMIRELIETKIGGRFGFNLWRDEDADDYSVVSDD